MLLIKILHAFKINKENKSLKSPQRDIFVNTAQQVSFYKAYFL